MPYKNPGDPEIEGWINRNEPIVGNLTLLGFLAPRTFYVTVAVYGEDTALARIGGVGRRGIVAIAMGRGVRWSRLKSRPSPLALAYSPGTPPPYNAELV